MSEAMEAEVPPSPVTKDEDVTPVEESSSPVAVPPSETVDETKEPDAAPNDSSENEQVVAKPPPPPSSPSKGTTAATDSNTTIEESPAPSTPTRRNTGEPTGKGAQILMNRFQSLKERANHNAQTLWSKSSPALSTNAKMVQERAEQFWKQTAAPKFKHNAGTFAATSSSGTSKEAADSKGATEGETKTNTTTGGLGEEETTSVAASAGITETASSPTLAESRSSEEVQPNQFSLNDPGTAADGDDDVDRGSSVAGAAGASDAATRLRVGQAFTKASIAATVAYESVLATGFRGRYNAAGASSAAEEEGEKKIEESSSSILDSHPMQESQTELILKSRVGQHMQEILEKLEPYEYAMLLGRGMLGVNLKQCYLKHHGVFIDFLVPGGQAELSGVVRSGDLPLRIGDLDLRKGTIMEIPVDISKARRPVVLTLATGTKVSLERMNYIDVAVAMMHRAREFYNKRGTLSNLPSASSPNRKGNHETMDIKSASDVKVPPADTIDSFLTPPAPTLDIRREFVDEVPLRYVKQNEQWYNALQENDSSHLVCLNVCAVVWINLWWKDCVK